MSHAASPSETLAGANLARPSRRLVSVLLLIAAFAMSMSCYTAMTHTLLYHSRDEGPNASYAISLYGGHLPTIDSPVAMDPQKYPMIYHGALRQEDDAHRQIWTANHPPLYYLLGVPFVALADAVHMPWITIVGMRLVAALGYGVSVLLIGLVAFEVTPRRPAAAVLATGAASSCAVLASASGHIMNDSVAVAFSSMAVLFTLRILRMGLTRNRLIVLTVAGALAASTKAPGVITVIMCGAALCVGLFLRNRSLKGLLKAVGTTAIATGVPGVVIGWFYVRNIVLYGDPTASSALLAKYQRDSPGTWLQVMTAPRFWHGWYDTLWVPWVYRMTLVHWIVDGLTALALVGVVLGVVGRIRDHRRGVGLEVESSGDADQLAPAARVRSQSTVELARTPSVATIGLLVLIAHAVVIIANLAQFRSGGGNPHERYLMTVLPLVAIVWAIGLLAFVDMVPLGEIRRREEIAATVFTGILLAFTMVMFLGVILSKSYAPHFVPALYPVAVAVLALGWLAGVAALPVALWRRRTPADASDMHIVGPRTSGESTLSEAGDELVTS